MAKADPKPRHLPDFCISVVSKEGWGRCREGRAMREPAGSKRARMGFQHHQSAFLTSEMLYGFEL